MAMAEVNLIVNVDYHMPNLIFTFANGRQQRCLGCHCMLLRLCCCCLVFLLHIRGTCSIKIPPGEMSEGHTGPTGTTAGGESLSGKNGFLHVIRLCVCMNQW